MGKKFNRPVDAGARMDADEKCILGRGRQRVWEDVNFDAY